MSRVNKAGEYSGAGKGMGEANPPIVEKIKALDGKVMVNEQHPDKHVTEVRLPASVITGVQLSRLQGKESIESVE